MSDPFSVTASVPCETCKVEIVRVAKTDAEKKVLYASLKEKWFCGACAVPVNYDWDCC
jgi:hypothetical protein